MLRVCMPSGSRLARISSAHDPRPCRVKGNLVCRVSLRLKPSIRSSIERHELLRSSCARGSTLECFDQALLDLRSGCLRQLFCRVTQRAYGGGGAATPWWRTALSHACHDDSPLLLRRAKPRGQVKCSGKQSPRAHPPTTSL